MSLNTTIIRRFVPLALVLAGACLTGYGVWRFTSTGGEAQAGESRAATAAVDRLKALGVTVGQMPGLPVEKLDFTGTAVKDEDLAVLADLPHVNYIDLSKTAVTDAGLAHLRHLNRLQFLRLTDTKVTDRGLANIENCRELDILHVANTGVELKGVKFGNLASLRIIDATGAPVTGEALANVAQATTLVALGLRKTKVGDAGLAGLKGLTRLEVLDLSGTALADDGVAALCAIDFPALRVLNFGGCTLTAKRLPELGGLKVKHLNLSGIKAPFPDLFRALGKAPALTELIVDQTAVRDEDLKSLAQDLPRLTMFQASNTKLSDAALEHLGAHPNLKLIVLYNTAVTTEAVISFRAAHPKIEVRHGKLLKGSTQVRKL